MTGPEMSAAAAIGGWVNVINTVWDAQRQGLAPAAAEKKPVIIVTGPLQSAATDDRLAARLRADGYQGYLYKPPDLGRG